MSEIKKVITEMVLYKIKPAHQNEYPLNGFQELRDAVAALKGFESFKTHKAVKNEGFYMDLVEWSSLAEAQEAAKQIQVRMEKGEFQKLMEALEKMEFFDHFNLVA